MQSWRAGRASGSGHEGMRLHGAGCLRSRGCLRSLGGNVFRWAARATGPRRRRLARRRRWPGGERSPGRRTRLGGRTWVRGTPLPAGGISLPWRTRRRRAWQLRCTGFLRSGPWHARLRRAGGRHARGRACRAVVRHSAAGAPAAGKPVLPGAAAGPLARRPAAGTAIRPAAVRPAAVRAGTGQRWSRPGRSRSRVPHRPGTRAGSRALRRRFRGPGARRLCRPLARCRLRTRPWRPGCPRLCRSWRLRRRIARLPAARPVSRPDGARAGISRRPVPGRAPAGRLVRPRPAARAGPATTRRAWRTPARRSLASSHRPASSPRIRRSMKRRPPPSSRPAGPGRARLGQEGRGQVADPFPRHMAARAGRCLADPGPVTVRRGTRGLGRAARSTTIPTGC